MSGVWVFKSNGVMQLVKSHSGTTTKRKALVHLATGQAVSSYSCLEQILRGLGWERYYGGRDPDLLQFHKYSSSSVDLISLPKDFAKFSSIHMYDIVVKNPDIFHVRDIIM